MEGAADDLLGQASSSSSSHQKQNESSKVRRIMGLETLTAEVEPGAEEEEQPGAKVEALERKRQIEAMRKRLKSARCWRGQRWRISS